MDNIKLSEFEQKQIFENMWNEYDTKKTIYKWLLPLSIAAVITISSIFSVFALFPSNSGNNSELNSEFYTYIYQNENISSYLDFDYSDVNESDIDEILSLM